MTCWIREMTCWNRALDDDVLNWWFRWIVKCVIRKTCWIRHASIQQVEFVIEMSHLHHDLNKSSHEKSHPNHTFNKSSETRIQQIIIWITTPTNHHLNHDSNNSSVSHTPALNSGASVCGTTSWRWVIGCLIFTCCFPPKSPIINVSFAKITCNLRHPMGLCHPVCLSLSERHCIRHSKVDNLTNSTSLLNFTNPKTPNDATQWIPRTLLMRNLILYAAQQRRESEELHESLEFHQHNDSSGSHEIY